MIEGVDGLAVMSREAEDVMVTHYLKNTISINYKNPLQHGEGFLVSARASA